MFLIFFQSDAIGSSGMCINCATTGEIKRNLVYNMGLYDIKGDVDNNYMEGVGGIGTGSSCGIEIMNNIIHDCQDGGSGWDAMAIDADWNSKNILIQYNYCYNNHGAGVTTMSSNGVKILNNRLIDNASKTCQGQIYVTANTPLDEFTLNLLDKDVKSTIDMSVSGNFIKASPREYVSMFFAKKGRGNGNWSGNVFTENRVVNLSDEAKSRYIVVEEDSAWYKFSNNKYYCNSTDHFMCLDFTRAEDINTVDGAQAYDNDKQQILKFENWAVRDLGSTFDLYDDGAPSKPTSLQAYADGKSVKLTWDKSSGDIWRYNIYMVKKGEKMDHRNMIDQTNTTSVTLTPSFKGEYYICIEPESNCGVLGEPLEMKLNLS